MVTFSKQFLSGSANGQPIVISATTAPGNLIHTADASGIDEVWLYANNTDSSARTLNLMFGSEKIVVGIPGRQGLVFVLPGIILSNSITMRAYSDAANAIKILGWVNAIR